LFIIYLLPFSAKKSTSTNDIVSVSFTFAITIFPTV